MCVRLDSAGEHRNKRSILLIAATIFLFSLISNANIIDMSYHDEGDGAIACTNGWDGNTNTLCIYGYERLPGPAHILGTIDTDTTDDPTLTITSAVDNDTFFAWTAYHVNIYMSQNFSIVLGSVSVDNVVSNVDIGDWTSQLTSQPQSTGTNYMGQLVFYSGTPLAPGDELDFSYAIQFTGSTHYSFTQEMIPVPEPGTFSLLLVGALVLARLTLLRRRHSLA